MISNTWKILIWKHFTCSSRKCEAHPVGTSCHTQNSSCNNSCASQSSFLRAFAYKHLPERIPVNTHPQISQAHVPRKLSAPHKKDKSLCGAQLESFKKENNSQRHYCSRARSHYQANPQGQTQLRLVSHLNIPVWLPLCCPGHEANEAWLLPR